MPQWTRVVNPLGKTGLMMHPDDLANDDWVVASVAEDNILQIWQMSSSIYGA